MREREVSQMTFRFFARVTGRITLPLIELKTPAGQLVWMGNQEFSFGRGKFELPVSSSICL